MHRWKLDLKVAGSDLNVTGLGINSQWSTNLQIGGFADAPRFTGRADLVRGNYDFAGRIFRLDRGVIRFNGESPPNPLLDIHAEAAVQGIDASVIVQGTGLKPEITFASSPPLPQDELLSRILFGTSITNLSAPEALQLATAVAALAVGQGQPRSDQCAAQGGRPRPAADRSGGRRDGPEDRDRARANTSAASCSSKWSRTGRAIRRPASNIR